MSDFETGERVRIDIPNERDPDHSEYHGRHGRIVTIIEDDAGNLTGDTSDSFMYRVEFDSTEQGDFRHADLRPPIDTEE